MLHAGFQLVDRLISMANMKVGTVPSGARTTTGRPVLTQERAKLSPALSCFLGPKLSSATPIHGKLNTEDSARRNTKDRGVPGLVRIEVEALPVARPRRRIHSNPFEWQHRTTSRRDGPAIRLEARMPHCLGTRQNGNLASVADDTGEATVGCRLFSRMNLLYNA
jgi:hypothetical protein